MHTWFRCAVCGVYVCCLCIVDVGLAIFSLSFILVFVFHARVGTCVLAVSFVVCVASGVGVGEGK